MRWWNRLPALSPKRGQHSQAHYADALQMILEERDSSLQSTTQRAEALQERSQELQECVNRLEADRLRLGAEMDGLQQQVSNYQTLEANLDSAIEVAGGRIGVLRKLFPILASGSRTYHFFG